jgi:hypothetical protein
MAAELDPAAQGIFCRKNIAGVLFFAEHAFFFVKHRLLFCE